MLTEIDFLTSPETRLSSEIRSEIKKIKRILLDVKDVFLNARAQALECEWQDGLAKLSKLLYDAEDLLDELKCEILARQVNKLNCVKYFLKIKLTRRSLDEMADTIKSIYEKNKQRRVYSREMEINHTFMGSFEVFG
ncbi:hypothetical protein Pint_25460 [Pistacia integerrima]|uniref:Uncharacterized protein n=1 Tax=Pistacia integerrima TaxID=434235 RepID=A0ACC0YI15_9ROSI|nr:hypothetical protein Pint_25460 [Pistacia integerrima]